MPTETEPTCSKAETRVPMRAPWGAPNSSELCALSAWAHRPGRRPSGSALPCVRAGEADREERPRGHAHIRPLSSGGTYRTRHLHPHVSAVQWRVATLPGSPLSSIRTFLVLPASHGEGKRVPAWTPPVPCVVGLSILLLERER